MPEIYIYAAEGRTVEQKRTLVREVTDAVVRNFNVPPEVVVIQFVEAARGDGDAAAVEEGDGLHCAVQQAAVVGYQQHRAGEAGEPLFEPERGFQV